MWAHPHVHRPICADQVILGLAVELTQGVPSYKECQDIFKIQRRDVPCGKAKAAVFLSDTHVCLFSTSIYARMGGWKEGKEGERKRGGKKEKKGREGENYR